jgi:hypothetical protein
MNTEEIPYSKFTEHIEKLKAEGQRVVSITATHSGYRLETAPMREHQQELDVKQPCQCDLCRDTNPLSIRDNSESDSHYV